MNQYQENKMHNVRAKYATSADFCQVFENDTSQLYLLAFMLTANHKDAERCFVATIDAAFKEHTVFKGWARIWVKRTLIKNAIEAASPLSDRGTGKRHLWSAAPQSTSADYEIDAVTKLTALERFIFVMSVLERYATWECSVLLGCDMKKVVQTRVRALCELPEADVLVLDAILNPQGDDVSHREYQDASVTDVTDLVDETDSAPAIGRQVGGLQVA
jgi:hypothetical protein